MGYGHCLHQVKETESAFVGTFVNGTWTRTYGDVFRGDVDMMALHWIFSSLFRRNFAFSYPYEVSVQFLLQRLPIRDRVSFVNFVRTFDVRTWLGIVLSVMACTGAFAIISYHRNVPITTRHQAWLLAYGIFFAECHFSLYAKWTKLAPKQGVLLRQLWNFMILILVYAFQGNLKASFSFVPRPNLIDNNLEAMESGRPAIWIGYSDVEFEGLKESVSAFDRWRYTATTNRFLFTR